MSAEFAPWVFVFVAAVCLAAGFAHGALGFGFPIVATPLVALVIGIKSAIALMAPATLALVVISALRGGGFLRLMREFWFLPPAMAVGAWAGTRLLLVAPAEPFLLVLAAVILLYLNLDRLGRWLRGALWVISALLIVQFFLSDYFGKQFIGMDP